MALLANIPKAGPFETASSAINTDLAFWGNYAIQGNYNGLQHLRHHRPGGPADRQPSALPRSQNDVSVWRNLVFPSADSQRNDDSCASVAQAGDDRHVVGGHPHLRLVQPGNPRWSSPSRQTAARTPTRSCPTVPRAALRLVLRAGRDVPRLPATARQDLDRRGPAGHPDRPRASSPSPFCSPTAAPRPPGHSRRPTAATTSPSTRRIDLAAGACMGEGSSWTSPTRRRPGALAVTDPNFAFWHSATFCNDGSTVMFTDELGGGTGAECNPPSARPGRGRLLRHLPSARTPSS